MSIKTLLFNLKMFSAGTLLCLTAPVFSQNTNRPPLMGWASWNNFYGNISENIIKGQADAIVSSGLSGAGYKYINIDDGYFKNRNPDGSLGVDAAKFPNGMKVVADYIHSKGLKAGIYTDAGSNTCGSLFGNDPNGKSSGIYMHDQADATLFFKTWGYDFLKVDYCGGRAQGLDEKTRYTAIKNAILNTGRTDINYNVCRWQFPGTWVTSLADSWRIADDINNTWGAVTRIIDANIYLAPFCSKGHYNDMDMLEVGRGMSAEEDKSHFSMWCIMSSPLLLGNDLRTVNQQTKNIVGNTEVIAVNQDTTGLQAQIVTDNGAGLQVLAKNLNGRQSTERAVLLFNRTASAAMMTVKWADLNLEGSATVRDLWTKTNLGSKATEYSVSVPSHGVVMLKVVGTKARLQETFEGEYAWINNFNLTQYINIVANQGRAVVDAACSGRAKASFIGNRADNFMEFRNVFASTTGKYKLTLTFQSGENRSAIVSINGKDTTLANLNSGSFTTLKTITFPVNLNKGNNVIKIGNASGYVPDIDKINIDLNKYNIITGLDEEPSVSAVVKILPNPFVSSFQIETNSPLKKAELYTLSGVSVGAYDQSTILTDNLKPGVYLLKITTVEDIQYQRIVKEGF
ncbi:MAG: T9SS type A sorting domain-containing protein [Opitutaceae bacterium]|nr:T9SS type A sorting domain-containing protein [Cytophagales bacterium]